MTLTVGSLFAGVGGFDLGLERAGMHVLWQVEMDPFCQTVLNKHWPDAPVYSDIREVRGKEVANVDVLCGGFPCQDISVDGKGAGIEGEKSSLWKEYARLVGELRPRYVIVENVSALRSRGLDVVLGDLSALGYDAEWDCIRASDVGAPHRRDRLWIVAYADDSCSARERRSSRAQATLAGLGNDGADRALADANSLGRNWRSGEGEIVPGRGESPHGSRRRRVFRDLADADSGAVEPSRDGRRAPEASELACAQAWKVEPDVGRVADGVPARVDRLRSLGNALVPQIAEFIGHQIVSYEAAQR